MNRGPRLDVGRTTDDPHKLLHFGRVRGDTGDPDELSTVIVVTSVGLARNV